MQFSGTVAAFNVVLDHNEVQNITAAGWLVAQGVPPPIDAAILVAASYIEAIDFIGGKNGVNISGVVAVGIIVTPRGIPVISQAIDLLNAAVNGSVNVVRGILNVVLGPIGVHLGSERGELHADEGNVGGQEQFVLMHLEEGAVALLCHTGYLCADHARNDEAWADRQGLGPWEKWDLFNNGDGTVSFTSNTGKYLCTDYNLSRKLYANRDSIASWEKFELRWQPNGTVSLWANAAGEYVSSAS